MLRSPQKDITKSDEDNEYNAISRTIWEDLGYGIWNLTLGLAPSLGPIMVGTGAFFSAQAIPRSTAFCSTLFASPTLVVMSQYLGMTIESTILLAITAMVLSEKSLAVSMKSLGRMLIISGLGTFVTWASGAVLQSETSSHNLSTEDLFFVFVDGVALSLTLVYASATMPSSGPLTYIMVLAVAHGSWRSFENLSLIERFEAVSKAAALGPYLTLCIGAILWMMTGPATKMSFLSTVIIICTIAAAVTCTVITILADRTASSHPLRTRMYRARIEQDRWERYAAISQSLKVAVSEYTERHGREPPPGFDVWYDFAKERNSVVIDHFEQIRQDFEPFWSLGSRELKSRLKEAKSLSGVETISINDGIVTSESQHPTITNMIGMIQLFSKHLPDMDIPINVAAAPKVLAPWHESGAHRSKAQDRQKLARRDANPYDTKLSNSLPLTASSFRHLISNTCPPSSPIQTYHYNIRDSCRTCFDPQSKTQFLRFHPLSLEICHQPDLMLLHDYHLSTLVERPAIKLLPIFSRTKTDAFSDILLPLSPFPTNPQLVRADNEPFLEKESRLFWRGHLSGKVSNSLNDHRVLLGRGHTERLLHLVNNATDERVPFLIPTLDHINTGHFTYEHILARELKDILDIDLMHLRPNETARETSLSIAQAAEFGEGMTNDGNMIHSRYILVQDTADGPPPANFLRAVLLSNATPFVASIFREWYTERLYPWVHFVPVDLRWQGLHSSLAYFTGFEGNLQVPGHHGGKDGRMSVGIPGRNEDGEWIARQSKKWMQRVARNEDGAIYTFRALLEWARLLSPDRRGFQFKS